MRGGMLDFGIALEKPGRSAEAETQTCRTLADLFGLLVANSKAHEVALLGALSVLYFVVQLQQTTQAPLQRAPASALGAAPHARHVGATLLTGVATLTST